MNDLASQSNCGTIERHIVGPCNDEEVADEVVDAVAIVRTAACESNAVECIKPNAKLGAGVLPRIAPVPVTNEHAINRHKGAANCMVEHGRLKLFQPENDRFINACRLRRGGNECAMIGR